MKLPGSARHARAASLVAVAVVLCLGIFLSWPGHGTGVPSALTMPHSPHADQGAGGDGQPTDWSYFVLPTEETEDVAMGPVNTDLLTALLQLAFFVATVGWLLGHGEFRTWDAARRPSFLTAREDAPFLEVFRL